MKKSVVDDLIELEVEFYPAEYLAKGWWCSLDVEVMRYMGVRLEDLMPKIIESGSNIAGYPLEFHNYISLEYDGVAVIMVLLSPYEGKNG